MDDRRNRNAVGRPEDWNFLDSVIGRTLAKMDVGELMEMTHVPSRRVIWKDLWKDIGM